MNILFLCADPGIPIRGTKGAAVHVRAMINAFAELGHSVTLITPRAGPVDGTAPMARLVQIAACSSPEDQEESAREIAQAVHRTATQEWARGQYDFIYERYSLWSEAGAKLSHARGVPLVLEVNAPLRIEASRYRTLNRADLAAEIEKRVFGQAHTLAVVSGALRDYVIEQGANVERVRVLPNAVDEKLFHPGRDGNATRIRLGLKGKFVVGFVGTVKPWHDLDTLIAAIAQLRPRSEQGAKAYHLFLVGDIPETVRAEIARNGLANDTTVVGPIPHGDVPSYIAAMDVAVSPHPALHDFYFSPLKLFEYLACGVATVASEVAPIRDVIIDGETGLLYPPSDASRLAQQIETLARNQELRARIAWAGARRVLQRHTWKHNAEQIIEFVCSDVSQAKTETNVTAVPLFDEKLGAHLFRATRADLATPWLTAHLPRHPFDSIAQFQILKYRPRRRCVIAYDLAMKGKRAGFSVIGKVFKDERGARHFAFYRDLWANGFGTKAADGITIPEPLAYIPEMRMLVQERAPGQTLEDLVDSPDFSERVCTSARAIAKLHQSQIRPFTHYTLDDELANLAHWAEEIAVWQPHRAESIVQQLDRLRAIACQLPRVDLAPAHRDFYYTQLLFADRRVTLIDLDMLSLADSAIDAANFIAHLRFLSLQKFTDWHRLDAAAALFLDEYARHRDASNEQEFSARMAFYEAATYFRLLHVVLKRPSWVHFFEPLYEMMEKSTARWQ